MLTASDNWMTHIIDSQWSNGKLARNTLELNPTIGEIIDGSPGILATKH
jgi:hypothetical protein